MHLPKMFLAPNIFRFAPRRGARTKAGILTTALVCALFSGFAQAGQGPSQYCSDNVGNEQHILNSPVTLNTEAGGPVGPQGWSWIVCFSPTPWGDGSPAPTGGALVFGANPANNAWVQCGSDNNTTVRFGCDNQAAINPTNPPATIATAHSANWVSVAGTGTSAPGADIGCAYGYNVGASGIGCSYGGPFSRSSQACADSGGNEYRLIHDPVTLDVEPGSSAGNADYLQVCYSTSPYASSGNGPTGGAVRVHAPTTSGQASFCFSDPAAQLRIDCVVGTSLNASNPGQATAGAVAASQLTALGTPVPTAISAGAGLGCTSGTVAISASNCAYGELLGISGTGTATSSGYQVLPGFTPGAAISGGGSAYGGTVGISGINSATSWAGISGTGTASGVWAISGGGNANSTGDGYLCGPAGVCVPASGTALSGLGNAYANVAAISGTGTANASGSGLVPGVAISGANTADGRDVAISGSGRAEGPDMQASLLNVSGGSGATSVAGNTIYINTGILRVAETPEQALDFAYVAPPEAVAAKEAALAQTIPAVIYNMATGLLEDPNESSTSSSSSSSTIMGPIECDRGCPAKVRRLSETLDDGQNWSNTCVSASLRSILLEMGANVDEGRLAAQANTSKTGTSLNAAARVLNQGTWEGGGRYQTSDTFYRQIPHDEMHYMSFVTEDIWYRGHGLMQAVSVPVLPWFAPQEGRAQWTGNHVNITFGYNHKDKGYLDVGEIWNPSKPGIVGKRGMTQDQMSREWLGGNPYGPHYNVQLARMWAALKANKGSPEGTMDGVVW